MLGLLAAMVALGVISSRPAPLPTPDDPQPVLQVFRAETPMDLLLSLPLKTTDQVRVAVAVPMGLEPLFLRIDTDGQVRELSPADRRQNGQLMEFSHPPLRPMPMLTQPGTKVFLVCAAPRAPRLDEVSQLLPTGPWPELPDYFLIKFTKKGAELAGPKGPRLPDPGVTAEIESRVRSLVRRLADRFPFIAGVAVPVR